MAITALFACPGSVAADFPLSRAPVHRRPSVLCKLRATHGARAATERITAFGRFLLSTSLAEVYL